MLGLKSEKTQRELKAGVWKLSNLINQQMELRAGKPHHWSLEDFEFGKFVSSGTFGSVCLVRERSTHMLLGLKVIEKEQIIEEKLQQQLVNEIRLHKQLLHPNIITLYTYFQNDSHIFLVMDFAACGTVHEYMIGQKNGRFCDAIAAKFIYQVSDALRYCHRLDIIHRDVKPENLLLDPYMDLKLSDFGWACQIGPEDKKPRRICGTDEYFPPEMVEHKIYGKAVDQWNVGVLSYEFLAGVTPFHSKDMDTTYRKIVNVRIRYPNYFSSSSKDLISKILLYNPHKRLNMDEIMCHSWIIENYQQ